MAFAFATFYVGSVLCLSVSSQVVPPVQPDLPGCSWNATRNCYGRLVPNLDFGRTGNGSINFEHYAQECASRTLPSDCYLQLTLCSEEIKANLNVFEEGYKRTRDVICDRNALEDIHKFSTCLNGGLMAQCPEKYQAEASDLHEQLCRSSKALLSCIGKNFPKSCPPDHEAAIATFRRFSEGVFMQHGCERSSQGVLAPERLIVGLVATIFILRLKQG